MRGLEEPEPAPLLERDLAVRQLDLDRRRHVTGAKEHCHLAKRRARLVQLEDAVDDEGGLLLLVARRHEPRSLAAGAVGPEHLAVSLPRAGDDGVGRIEDRLGRAVVLLERDQRAPSQTARGKSRMLRMLAPRNE